MSNQITRADERPQAGMTRREEFAATELTVSGETAGTAVAAQARAAIEARYVMAYKRPRDLDMVRQMLLKECQRPGFAEVARYHKPIGKGVSGPSIRFTETAIRCMTNILVETRVVFDSVDKRIVNVSVTDLEANITYPQDIAIEKTVERSKVPDGETALSQRQNSYGKTTYLLRATEDDLLNKQNALISKAIRTSGQRLIPGDITEEAMRTVIQVQKDKDAKDPAAARKAIVDGFGAIGIKVSDLKEYIGHELDSLTPPELVELRGLYAAIRDGEASWKEVMASRAKVNEAGDTLPVADLKDRLKQKQAAKATGEAAPAPAPSPAPKPTPKSQEPPPGAGDSWEPDEDGVING